MQTRLFSNNHPLGYHGKPCFTPSFLGVISYRVHILGCKTLMFSMGFWGPRGIQNINWIPWKRRKIYLNLPRNPIDEPIFMIG